MPEELREPLRAEAERNGRSLNAEIVARLEGSLAPKAARRRPRLLPLAAALAVVALGGAGGYVLTPAPADGAAAQAPASKRVLLGDPLGSSLPTR
jgi:hypothetical protein